MQKRLAYGLLVKHNMSVRGGKLTVDIKGVAEVPGELPNSDVGVCTAAKAHLTTDPNGHTQDCSPVDTEEEHRSQEWRYEVLGNTSTVLEKLRETFLEWLYAVENVYLNGEARET